ncbi:class I SAM-dependent methyltransferase [Candidatus Sumerlaeota bacterium]|nr:class I SAM-dependent methyltransferase [Candidatus Sumerlaeota bacterium]
MTENPTDRERQGTKYTFGTGPEAASRLGEISKFFNPLAQAPIEEVVVDPPAVAVDLGCGPGFTTDMLSRSARPGETWGLDRSPAFLALARERFPHCRFIEHDVTTVPFPSRPDVMYARFVLSHLLEPVEIVRRWVGQLAVGGVLVVEEVEAVETDVEVFRRYLSTNEILVASQGARLFVGAELAGRDYGARVVLDDCPALPVADSQAATWFLPNTQTIWRENACVLERWSPREIEEISNALSELANSDDRRSRTVWKMRRIVLRRD